MAADRGQMAFTWPLSLTMQQTKFGRVPALGKAPLRYEGRLEEILRLARKYAGGARRILSMLASGKSDPLSYCRREGLASVALETAPLRYEGRPQEVLGLACKKGGHTGGIRVGFEHAVKAQNNILDSRISRLPAAAAARLPFQGTSSVPHTPSPRH